MGHVIIHGGYHMRNERNDVISSAGKRRRFSLAEKQQLVAATLKPGASVAAVAREAGIRATQLYGWRLRLRESTPEGFAPVRIAPEAPGGTGTLEIEFATGARMRISGAVDIAVMSVAVAALARGRRR
jgi:transposase